MAALYSASLASLLIFLHMRSAHSQLRENFYSSSCRNLEIIVRISIRVAAKDDPRLPASLVRLFFHDCFINGCDASVLLADDGTFRGEQGASPNKNSLRGMNVIETIKSRVEALCKGVVSCADILALASRDSVVLSGGPSWGVRLGRRDARMASFKAANSDLPGPSSSLSFLVSSFARKGLNLTDLVALSGAHTFGFASCRFFRNRIYNDPNIDPVFAASTRVSCPRIGGDNILSPLDVSTRNTFDNVFYKNILSGRGLLHSDQELFSDGFAGSIVRRYANSSSAFFRDFAAAMVKLGNIRPLTSVNGEIRRVCSRVN